MKKMHGLSMFMTATFFMHYSPEIVTLSLLYDGTFIT